MASFYKKLDEAKQKYSTYDKKFYVVIQSLRYWPHYLLLLEFILFSDHEALKYLGSQKKHNSQHAKWVEYLQEYIFVIKHKSSLENIVTYALSRKVFILHTMSLQVTRFDKLREDYESCPEFGTIFHSLQGNRPMRSREFMIQDGYFFWGLRLCLPRILVRDFLI